MVSVNKDSVWGGSDGGQIVIIHVRDDGVAQEYILQHGDTTARVSGIVASAKDGFAWTYLEEGELQN